VEDGACFAVLGLGFRVLDFRLIRGRRCVFCGPGSRAWGIGFRVEEREVSGLGFRFEV
jgi:hypothetical protein